MDLTRSLGTLLAGVSIVVTVSLSTKVESNKPTNKAVQVAFNAVSPTMIKPVIQPDVIEASPIKPLVDPHTSKQIECLADNIYYEAGIEPHIGKVAVARVVMNRAQDPRWPKTPCKVIYQGAKFAKHEAHKQRGGCQFSWLCQGKTPERPDPKVYAEAKRVAIDILLHNKYSEKFAGLVFYHGNYINPGWPYQVAARVGRHIFYKG